MTVTVSSSFVDASLSEIFAESSLSILPTLTSNDTDSRSLTSSSIINCDLNENSNFKTTAYFRDTTSGRAKVLVPLFLQIQSVAKRNVLIDSGAIVPSPLENEKLQLTDEDAKDYGEESDDEGDRNELNQDLMQVKSQEPNDGSTLWDSELATLGIGQRGVSEDKYDSIDAKLKFECSCCQDETNVDVDLKEKDKTENDFKYNQSAGKTNDRNTEKISTGTAVVEAVSVLSTSLIGGRKDDVIGIRFDVEVVVRSQCPFVSTILPNDTVASPQKGQLNSGTLTAEFQRPKAAAKVNLDIRSILEINNIRSGTERRQKFQIPSTMAAKDDEDVFDDIYLGVQAVDQATDVVSLPEIEDEEGCTSSSYFAETSNYIVPSLSRSPLKLNVDLVPALTLSVHEVSGGASLKGVTLVSLVISHSNAHDEEVTLTNVALHPGHSRLFDEGSASDSGIELTISDSLVDTNGIAADLRRPANPKTTTASTTPTTFDGKAMPGGEHSVVNMTRYFRWEYASGTALSLPLSLQPNEAISTVIQINASENMTEKYFVCPVCVRAVVGGASVGTDVFRDENRKGTSMILVSADTKWTTSRVAQGLVDAFRVNLSIQESECVVGAQVVLSLRVMNLSSETRDLMLVMAKDSYNGKDSSGGDISATGGSSGQYSSKIVSTAEILARPPSPSNHMRKQPTNSINNAVISEVNGYKFGVLGLSDDDDGTVRYDRDHELLAVDAALLLGEVKGQHSIEAELRFVPLREGTLDVPNLKLYDKFSGQWYDCLHTLKIVSTNKSVSK